jgi:uncharacterized protein
MDTAMVTFFTRLLDSLHAREQRSLAPLTLDLKINTEGRTLPDNLERRFLPSTLELRAAKDGKGPGTIVGYAATFDQASVDLGGFIETLAPGAFSSVLEDDCRCLRNHGDDNLLGRTTAGTLRLEQDASGLRYECDLPDTSTGRDTAESIRRKDITGCSFQFTIADGGAQWDFNGAMAQRRITKIGRLYDVGPVTFPAYESTRVDMRSVEAARAAADALRAEQSQSLLTQAKARQRLAEAHFPL